MNQKTENNGVIDLSKPFADSEIAFQKKTEPSEKSFYSEISKISQWLIRFSGGLVKNEKQAVFVLLGLIAFIFILSLFLIFNKEPGPKNFAPIDPVIEKSGSPEEIIPY